MKSAIPPQIPAFSLRHKKIPASFIDPKKSLLAKISDLPVNDVSGAPGTIAGRNYLLIRWALKSLNVLLSVLNTVTILFPRQHLVL